MSQLPSVYQGPTPKEVYMRTSSIGLMPLRSHLVHKGPSIAYTLCEEFGTFLISDVFHPYTPRRINDIGSKLSQLVDYVSTANLLATKHGFRLVFAFDTGDVFPMFQEPKSSSEVRTELYDSRLNIFLNLAIGTQRLESNAQLDDFFNMLKEGDEFVQIKRKGLVELLK